MSFVMTCTLICHFKEKTSPAKFEHPDVRIPNAKP